MISEHPITGPELNHRLRNRRLEFGATLAQTAAWADLSTERLRDIESSSTLRSWEFEALCRALAVDSGALARGEDSSPHRSVARFKSADWLDPKPGDYRTLALAAEHGRIGRFLAQQLGRDSRISNLRNPLPVEDTSEPWQQGYRLGESARRALAPRSGPITDLESLLHEWGVHVAHVEFSSRKLDAASLWEAGALPVVLLNGRSMRAKAPLSRRALLAHELCHLLHDSGERDLTTQLSWSEQAGNYAKAVEQRARAFAPAFLAPRDEVRHWFRAGEGRRISGPASKVEALARRWGFSLRGAIWHALNCGIIHDRTAQRLSLQASVDRDHEWSSEFERTSTVAPASRPWGEAVVPIVRGLLADLAEEGVAKNVISEGRGYEIVTWG